MLDLCQGQRKKINFPIAYPMQSLSYWSTVSLEETPVIINEPVLTLHHCPSSYLICYGVCSWCCKVLKLVRYNDLCIIIEGGFGMKTTRYDTQGFLYSCSHLNAFQLHPVKLLRVVFHYIVPVLIFSTLENCDLEVILCFQTSVV